MPEFVRGMKVITSFGEGIVVNLPVRGRIAVQYPNGVVRFFWPEDVEKGAIRPLSA